jgi:hypothetical protein
VRKRKSRISRRPILRTSHKMAKIRRMMEATARMCPKGNPVRKKVIRAMSQMSPGLVIRNCIEY